MPEKSPGEPPSRWIVISDYSKTVVTLCAGLLGFLAAFSEKLQIAEASSGARTILIFAIIFLLVAIGFALSVNAKMDTYLRICALGDPKASPPGTATDVEWNTIRLNARWWCKLCCNASFIFLFLAAVALAAFTIARFTNLKSPANPSSPTCCKCAQLPNAGQQLYLEFSQFGIAAAKAYADAAGIARDAAKTYAESVKSGCGTCCCETTANCDESCPKPHSHRKQRHQ